MKRAAVKSIPILGRAQWAINPIFAIVNAAISGDNPELAGVGTAVRNPRRHSRSAYSPFDGGRWDGAAYMHWAITGGTGFLGTTSCANLAGTWNVHFADPSAVRPDRSHTESARIAGTNGQVWTNEQLRERLAVVSVDLAEPNLGLPDERFQVLADSIDAILHCAASTEVDADLAALRRVNVDGTARILELAQAGSRGPDLFYVSTAFVAGRRRTGVIYETELSDDAGFETNYKRLNSRPSRWCGTGHSAQDVGWSCFGRASWSPTGHQIRTSRCIPCRQCRRGPSCGAPAGHLRTARRHQAAAANQR